MDSGHIANSLLISGQVMENSPHRTRATAEVNIGSPVGKVMDAPPIGILDVIEIIHGEQNNPVSEKSAVPLSESALGNAANVGKSAGWVTS